LINQFGLLAHSYGFTKKEATSPAAATAVNSSMGKGISNSAILGAAA